MSGLYGTTVGQRAEVRDEIRERTMRNARQGMPVSDIWARERYLFGRCVAMADHCPPIPSNLYGYEIARRMQVLHSMAAYRLAATS